MKRFAILLALLAAGCAKPDIVRVDPDSSELWITSVSVLDVVDGTLSAPRDVHLVGERIESIEDVGAAPADARKIDGKGATLLPGLIDAHMHLANSGDPLWTSPGRTPALNMQRLLYSGVTTVLETGGMTADSFARRADVAAGEAIGPRIFTAGPIFTAVGGHPIPMVKHAAPRMLHWYVIPRMTRQVHDAASAQEAVDELLPLGPDVVKLVLDRIPDATPVMSTEVARAVVERAKRGGVRAVAHIGTTTDAISAAEAGVAAWVHGVYQERIPDAAIARLARYRIPMVPTLVVFESYARGAAKEPRVATGLERELVDPRALGAFGKRPADFELPAGADVFLARLAKRRNVGFENVRRLHEAGVVMLAGSDAQTGVYHGPGLHQELHLLVRAGLTPIEAIRGATIHAARFLEQSATPRFGVVEPGKVADLLLVDGDPRAEIDALARIRAVIQKGRLLERRPPKFAQQ